MSEEQASYSDSSDEHRRYHIVTIKDAFEQIPIDKIDAFLADLRGMMKHHKVIASLVSELAKQEIKSNLDNGFVWIDDGRHDLKLYIEEC